MLGELTKESCQRSCVMLVWEMGVKTNFPMEAADWGTLWWQQ